MIMPAFPASIFNTSKLKFSILLLAFLAFPAVAENLLLESPDGALKVTVDIGKQVRWSVHHQGKPIITPSEIGMVINGADHIAQKVTVTDATRRDVDEIII